MGNKYTVVGNLRKPHKDCEGETLKVNGKRRKNTKRFSISNKTKLNFYGGTDIE